MAGAGTSAEATVEASLTKGITKISESLYELYSPPSERGYEAELIFFHGLLLGNSKDEYEKAYWKTWLSTDGTVIWPKEWLKLHAPTARVLSVKYKCSASLWKGETGEFDMYNYGENLVADIITNRRGCGQQPGRPVILVGHSLGGIMIKQFILSAFRTKNQTNDEQTSEKISNFLENFKGVYFYSVPNGGSEEIQKYAATLKNPSPLLANLRVLSTKTQRINEEFRMLRDNKLQHMKVRSGAICELLETNSPEFHGVVVVDASARQDVDSGLFYTYHEGDHFTVCRARDEEDFTVIAKLVDFTKNRIEEAQGYPPKPGYPPEQGYAPRQAYPAPTRQGYAPYRQQQPGYYPQQSYPQQEYYQQPQARQGRAGGGLGGVRRIAEGAGAVLLAELVLGDVFGHMDGGDNDDNNTKSVNNYDGGDDNGGGQDSGGDGGDSDGGDGGDNDDGGDGGDGGDNDNNNDNNTKSIKNYDGGDDNGGGQDSGRDGGDTDGGDGGDNDNNDDNNTKSVNNYDGGDDNGGGQDSGGDGGDSNGGDGGDNDNNDDNNTKSVNNYDGGDDNGGGQDSGGDGGDSDGGDGGDNVDSGDRGDDGGG